MGGRPDPFETDPFELQLFDAGLMDAVEAEIDLALRSDGYDQAAHGLGFFLVYYKYKKKYFKDKYKHDWLSPDQLSPKLRD